MSTFWTHIVRFKTLKSLLFFFFLNFTQRPQHSATQHVALPGAEWVSAGPFLCFRVPMPQLLTLSCYSSFKHLCLRNAGRVFVTYEADDDKHVNEIINFVALLRHNGFDTHVCRVSSRLHCAKSTVGSVRLKKGKRLNEKQYCLVSFFNLMDKDAHYSNTNLLNKFCLAK